MLKPRRSARGLDLGRVLGWVGLEWGEGSARVGALGRVRIGEVDGEFLGDWRGEGWGESCVCWSFEGED